ncbi:CBS domain-containing protein [candidate division KSB1 bacterium]|nr:CBS domain-containing protein [candidate division KSB1 bacterium]
MKIKDVLAAKGSDVITIDHKKSVFEAMGIFAAHRVGSLLVLNNQKQIVGIIAARDVLMQVLHNYEKIKEVKVEEFMTKDIIVGKSDDELEYVEAVMTENRIRHLPVIDESELAGIISIGDVVKARLKEVDVENRYLKDFIIGKYPG